MKYLLAVALLFVACTTEPEDSAPTGGSVGQVTQWTSNRPVLTTKDSVYTLRIYPDSLNAEQRREYVTATEILTQFPKVPVRMISLALYVDGGRIGIPCSVENAYKLE